jgi:replicative DNA helicase
MEDGRDTLRDDELERTVVGIWLAYPEQAERLLTLTPDHFAAEHWREASHSIRDIHTSGRLPDFHQVRANLQDRKKLDVVGIARLMHAVDCLPRPTDDYLDFLVHRLGELQVARRSRYLFQREISRLEDNPSIVSDGFFSNFLGEVETIRNSGPRQGLHGIATINGVVSELVDDIKQGDTNRVKLGVWCLDRATRGIEPGEFVMHLGRTDSLKTMLYTNQIRYLVKQYPDACWLVANMEMPKKQMLRRMVRMEMAATDSQLDEAARNDNGDVERAAAEYEGRVFFVDRGAMSLSEIEEHAEALQRSCPSGRTLRGIFIDHAGLVRGERGMTSAYDRASATARGLKQLARRLNVIVFAVVQANRSSNPTDNEPVALEGGRDTGEYEENADFALCYSRRIEPPEPSGQPFIRLKLRKNRRGMNVPFEMAFDPKTLRMAERIGAETYGE